MILNVLKKRKPHTLIHLLIFKYCIYEQYLHDVRDLACVKWYDYIKNNTFLFFKSFSGFTIIQNYIGSQGVLYQYNHTDANNHYCVGHICEKLKSISSGINKAPISKYHLSNCVLESLILVNLYQEHTKPKTLKPGVFIHTTYISYWGRISISRNIYK